MLTNPFDSGVAYCELSNDSVSDAKQIQTITNWPGLARGNNEKVPSRISYGLPGNREIKWGNEITHKTKGVHALMKLRLDEKTESIKDPKSLIAYLGSADESLRSGDVVDVVTDYLTRVREHIFKELSEQYGPKVFRSLYKDIVVTCPAVWGERAKDLTLEAVNRAMFQQRGRGNLLLVTEPEAAAVYTLNEMQNGAKKSSIAVGDNFVLCDAGGGTVDLISYHVTRTNPTFKIEEAVIGSDNKCGASYVNRVSLPWSVESLLLIASRSSCPSLSAGLAPKRSKRFRRRNFALAAP